MSNGNEPQPRTLEEQQMDLARQCRSRISLLPGATSAQRDAYVEDLEFRVRRLQVDVATLTSIILQKGLVTVEEYKAALGEEYEVELKDGV